MFALFLENIPMLFFSLPLIAAASVVFAATHHESPPVIWRATAEWAMWFGWYSRCRPSGRLYSQSISVTSPIRLCGYGIFLDCEAT